MIQSAYVLIVQTWMSSCSKCVLIPQEEIKFDSHWFADRWKPYDDWLEFDVGTVITSPGKSFYTFSCSNFNFLT